MSTAPLPFSESGVEAVRKARSYAQRWGHDFVGTEHLLLGTLDTTHDDEALRGICEELTLTVERVTPALLRFEGRGHHTGKVHRPNTTQFQTVIMKAQEEAERFGGSQVFPRHLLLALIPASEEEYDAKPHGAGAVLNMLGFPLGNIKNVFYDELVYRDRPADQLVPAFVD